MTAVALRALPVPDCEPPDDLTPATHHRGTPEPGPPRVRAVQGVLSLVVDNGRAGTLMRTFAPADVRQPVDQVPGAPDRHASTEHDQDFGPRRTATGGLPSAGDWGRMLAQVVVEVMCAQRPAPQLLRHTSQRVYDQIVSQTLPPGRRGAGAARRRPRVTSVLVCEPADGVAELSAVVHGQYRVQALALRLEGRDGRWRVTALECG